MSFQYEPFLNNWLAYDSITDPFANRVNYTVNLDVSFFHSLRYDSDSTKSYRIEAALSAYSQLGSNPVLCLSGGIDSQVMIQCWKEAGIKFDVATMVFNDSFNDQDVDHARLYCNVNNIPLIEIPINVISFLTRESYAVGEKYKCTSPQFAVHYQMFDILRSMGYTGICCGGNTFAKSSTGWGPAPSVAQSNYIEYANMNSYPVIGNFLGHDPRVCWAIALLTPSINLDWYHNPDLSKSFEIRYETKIKGYENFGFNVMPQKQKYTGFEKVKYYFEKKHNDGWAFEKLFRLPLQKKYGSAIGNLILDHEQESCLNDLYYKIICSSNAS